MVILIVARLVEGIAVGAVSQSGAFVLDRFL
jgi:hypothetical protein